MLNLSLCSILVGPLQWTAPHKLSSSKKKLQHLKTNIKLWRATVQSRESSITVSLKNQLEVLDNKAESGPLSFNEATARINILSLDDSQLLDQPFTLQEIKNTVWECGGDKAPGPDRFTFKFVKKHWDVIKDDIVAYVKEFEATSYIPRGCNSSFIILIPKVEDPLVIGDYRPISLIGCQYKIISKVLANRLAHVISSVIGDTQMAFIKGRQIIDGPLIVDEIISWAKSKKKKVMFLKVDFEKAFDTLNMDQMGFSSKWRNWISHCLNSAFASVLINGSPTKEFKVEKGLRQGDPLSPFLFIIAIEALNVALLQARNNNIFHGTKVGKDNIHISHIQFADDALIMGEWSLRNAMNISRILTCFHLASGLKVNYNKSKLYDIGVISIELNSLASTIGCLPSHFPCTYLGLPIGAKMSRCANWNVLIDKFQKRLSSWKSKSLSIGGRLTLIKSFLCSLGVYYFSTFKAPLEVINKLEGLRRKFFWGGNMDEKKISWNAWNKVITHMSCGCLGIGDLISSNLAMLCKWWWRFHTEHHALWREVIQSIHGMDGGLNDISSVKSKTGLWFRIAKLKDDLLKYNVSLPSTFKKKVGDGSRTMFWHDEWLGGLNLKETFPKLFRLETHSPSCR
ncbi:putative RNA-directed DNA polymerase [Tanacetum coccineum]